MKNFLIFLLFTFYFLIGTAQTSTNRIVGNKTRVYNPDGTPNELILENATKSKAGAFLRNRLNGETDFEFVIDSLRISGDTIFFRKKGISYFKLPSRPVSGAYFKDSSGVLIGLSDTFYIQNDSLVWAKRNGQVKRFALGSGDGSSATYIVREVPSGTINNSNTSFTLANAPTSGKEQVYLNGILQTNTDYTLTGSLITLTTAPITDDNLVATYIYGGSSLSASNYILNEIPSGSINGVNTSFTLLSIPITGKEMVFLNGVLQTILTDYTISNGQITFVAAPATLDKISVNYLK